MIIKNIYAQNVLKYKTLELCDIPSTGLIAISGPNESGKSTIGETLCFAFFGQTFSLCEPELQKIIRWGETNCSVTVDFEVDGVDYRIIRSLDNKGTHSARLARADSLDQDHARGVDAVSSALSELLGYAFEEFIESFYLAQREISTPHPQSQAIKMMAGLVPLERVSHAIEREIVEENEQLLEIDAEISANNADLQDLGLEVGWLARLQARREELSRVATLNAQEEESLARLSTSYIIALPKWKDARSSLVSMRLMGIALLIITILGGSLWALLAFGPEFQAGLTQQLRSLVVQLFAGFQDRHIPWVGYTAAGLAALTAITWFRIMRRSRHIKQLANEGIQLAKQLATAREILDDITDEELAGAISPEPVVVATEEDANEVPPTATANEELAKIINLATVRRADQADFTAINGQIGQMTAKVVAVRDYMKNERAWFKTLLIRQNTAVSMLDSQIADEQTRLHQTEHLVEMTQNLEQKRSDSAHQITLREAALGLLEGNKEQLSSRFNHNLKEQVGRTLLLFTKGKYEHLQISEHFDVRIFSNEKLDFMDLEEVSSGTQRQVMLAIRLTLAEQLLTRAAKERQFVFLDEPFAFFDEERTQESLRGLAGFSAAASQMFIVAQSFPKGDVDYAMKIDCDPGQQDMIFASSTGDATGHT